MKKLFSMFLIFLIVSVSLSGCGKKYTWETLKEVSVPSPVKYIVGFNSEDFGIAAGYGNAVSYTTDGGENWSLGNNESLCRFGLEIVGTDVAYTCGNGENGGHVRRTTDGGANWENKPDYYQGEPNQCRYLSFINDKEGWISAPDKLAYTNDGGSKWTDIELPQGIGNILGINLIDNKTGYIVDDTKKLYSTEDGGDNWSYKELDFKDMDTTVKMSNDLAMKFDNKNNGIIIYCDNGEKIHCARTTDGGKKWTEDQMPDLKANVLFLSDDGKLLTVSDGLMGKAVLIKLK